MTDAEAPNHAAPVRHQADAIHRVCVEVPAEGLLLDALRRGSSPRFSIIEGSTGLVAWGEAARVDLPAEGRFDQARRAVAALGARMVTDVTPDAPDPSALPLCLVGFSFAPRAGAGPWQGWPAASVVVPEVMVFTQGPLATVIAHLPAGLDGWDGDPTELVGRLLDEPCPVGAPERAHLTRTELEAQPAFERRVRDVVEATQTSSVDKVVLARAVRFDASATLCPVSTAHALHAAHPRSATFLWERPGQGTYLGATPETLARVTGASLQTHALAGTAPGTGDEARDAEAARLLLSSDKDRAEQDFVLRAMQRSLAPLCSELDAGRAPEVLRLREVQHLVTPVTGTLHHGRDVFDVLAALHPTPALGGFPAEAAQTWLDTHEALDRGWYGGTLGWVAPEAAHFVVAIRSALLQGKRALAFAGAGIVRGSDPATEWQETERKLGAASAALATEVAS